MEGFGTRMIDHLAAMDLDGESSLDFRPEGVAWRLATPMEPAGEEAPACAPVSRRFARSAPPFDEVRQIPARPNDVSMR